MSDDDERRIKHEFTNTYYMEIATFMNHVCESVNCLRADQMKRIAAAMDVQEQSKQRNSSHE